MRTTRLLPVIACGLLSLAAAGCASRPLGTDPEALDPKLTLSSYMEDGKLVALVVSTKVTRLREAKPYIPLEIIVANKGLPGLTLTPETFYLVDEQGARYPVVGYRELIEGYGNIDIDRKLAELPGVALSKFGGYEQSPATLTRSFDKPIQLTTKLPRFNYVVDFIYFPTPRTGVRGHRFELFLEAPELEDPVFVRFEVTGRRKTTS